MSNQPANAQTLFTEIFPIKQGVVPQLFAYRLDVAKGSDFATIGGKLAYRLNRMFEGHWAWAGGNVLTDAPQDISQVMKAVDELRAEQPKIFRGLRKVTEYGDWQINARAVSEYVARGLLADVRNKVETLLAQRKQDLGKAYVDRVYDLRGWVVDGAPAISLSITSRLVLKEDLKAFAAKNDPNQLIGLTVADKTSTLKGEITEIVGYLGEQRATLLSYKPREEIQKLIETSPDTDLVVTVSTGRDDYDYVIGALRIVLLFEYMHKFGVNSKKALGALRLEPKVRADIVKDVSGILSQTGYIDRSFNSKVAPHLFKTTSYTGRVRLGNDKIIPYNEQTIINDLRNNGLYRIADRFTNGGSIRVGLLTALNGNAHVDFWREVEGRLRPLRLSTHIIGEQRIKEASRAELDKAVSEFQSQDPDILVAFFPDDFADEDDDETGYYHFKSLTIGRGIPSQVIEGSTLQNEKSISSSVNNIVLGVLGKTGNIPYVLAEPLPFADVIVGIDIARTRKKHLPGSLNATAIARIYLSNGEFLQYVIHDAPLEGETIPTSVLQTLFPVNEFAGKKVVIHRDGLFRGDEKADLLSWARKINAQFYPVEVIKSGAPRVYASIPVAGNGQQFEIGQPQKGSAFITSATEALLVSSLPPFKNATPQPLRIRTDAPFTIDQALLSVLAMTNLHYGSVRPPRLPVTIHFSDKIAYMALRGIKPKNLEGKVPFWL